MPVCPILARPVFGLQKFVESTRTNKKYELTSLTRPV